MQQWVALYDGSGNSEIAAALALDDLGNVYVTGESGGDYATVKYNPSGLKLWAIRYNGPGHGVDAATDIALDAACNVYVTGSSEGIGTSSDYATIKYVQTPVMARSSTQPEQMNPVAAEAGIVKLNVKAFPNAFTDYINLQWSGNDKPVTITITDMLGRMVEKVTGLASSGNIRTGHQFKAGVYFAEIVQGTEKLVLKLVKK